MKSKQNKALIGIKLSSLKKYIKAKEFHIFLGISSATYSRYGRGEVTPSIGELNTLIDKYAKMSGGKLIDMNWLVDEDDRREGPIFIGAAVPSGQGEDRKASAIPQNQATLLDRPLNSRPMTTPRIHIDDAEWWQDDRPQWVTRGAGAADSSNGQRVPDTDDLGDTEQPPEGLTLVPVEGDSMEPVVLDKQYVMVDKYREGFEGDGGIVVAVVSNKDDDGFGTYIKRCFKDGDSYVFESEMPYPDLFFPIDRVQRIWPVIGVWFAGKGKAPKRKHRGSAT